LDEGKIVRGLFVIASCDPTTLLDPVKEPFDRVAGSVEIRAEADRIVAIAFWWDVGPRASLGCVVSDPVRVGATVGKPHRS
jgi:hypothetical protein